MSYTEHITALIRSHAEGDNESFYTTALQIAASEARKGHTTIAKNMKKRSGKPHSN